MFAKQFFAALIALAAIVSTAVATPAVAADGVIVVASANDVKTTMDKLEKVLTSKGITIFARIDHAAGAKSIGQTLRPMELLVFGNPKLGTPLMQSNPTIGLDLPQKFLVWEDAAGDVFVSYNAPDYLAQRHDIGDQDEVFGRITGALNAFATAAASAE